MFSSNEKIIECVPNFSEGNDISIIDAIAHAIERVDGVKLLHKDIGKAANRTVFTFVGTPQAVCDACFNAIEVTSRLIDMTRHKGTHPRIGAADVCPLIPVANISIDEVKVFALALAQRVGNELSIPVYCYEESSSREYRKKLEQIRKGQYELFADKMSTPGWEPDYGPQTFNAQTGATVIGARNLLIAFNINLETKSVDIAKEIAAEIRESGKTPDALDSVKAIGWYVDEFDVVQVSTNITNFEKTPIHKVFEVVSQKAASYGTKVIGSELVGLIPLKALVDAGLYFAKKGASIECKDINQIIALAIAKLGLNSVKECNPQKHIIEFAAGITIH